jgi:hypothetical protein
MVLNQKIVSIKKYFHLIITIQIIGIKNNKQYAIKLK